MNTDADEYKLLPINPDHNMRIAGNKAIDKCKEPTHGLRDQAYYCYMAMVQVAPVQEPILSIDDLNIIRQWYNSITDVNLNFLDEQDTAVYIKIMSALDMNFSPRDIQVGVNQKKET